MPLLQITANNSTGSIPTVGAKEIYTTGVVYYVDSNNGNDTSAGTTPATAMATLAAALAVATANKGDVIILMPGHAETLTAELTVNVEGVSILGLGQGDNRPQITFGTDTAAGLTIASDNVTIRDVIFKNDIDSQVHMFDVTKAYFVLDHCELWEGSSKQVLDYIDFSGADADHCTIRDCQIVSKAAGANSGIKIGAAIDDLRLLGNRVIGDFSDAALQNPTGTVATNLLIAGGVYRNDQTGDHAIQLVSAVTGEGRDVALFSDAVATCLDPGSVRLTGTRGNFAIDQGSVELPLGASAEDFIGADNADNNAATTNVAANEDGSLLERLEQLQEAINIGSGTSLGANKSLVDALGTDGVTLVDDAASIVGILGVDDANNAFASSSVAANRDGSILERLEHIVNNLLAETPGTYVPGLGYKVTKTEDVNVATGDDLFTVTGKVLVTLWSGEVTNALDAAVTDYKLRVKTSNIDLCAASNIASAAIGFMFNMNGDAGDTLINTASATEAADVNGKGLASRVIGKASGSITLESNRTAGAASDAIVHTLFYLPLEASAAVAAAA
jgi:hypothetical protein